MSGSVEFQGETVHFIEVAGSGTKMVWTSSQEHVQKVESVPIFIIDFSYSMQNSVQLALDAIRKSCKQLFEDGLTDVHLVFFGVNVIHQTVTSATFMDKIAGMMNGYPHGNCNLQGGGTKPELGFKYMVDHILPQLKLDTQVDVIFMTDGEFNGIRGIDGYNREWKSISDSVKTRFPLLKLSVNMTGYQNDKLQNVKDMHTAFVTSQHGCVYQTITNPGEIAGAMARSLEDFKTEAQKVFKFGSIILKDGVPTYSEKTIPLIVTELTDAQVTSMPNFFESTAAKFKITSEWLREVVQTEILIGLKGYNLETNFVGATAPNKEALFKDALLFADDMQKRYLRLKGQVKSINSRNISYWSALAEQTTSFFDILRDLQTMISGKLSEKKQYEQATRISSHISDRHNKTLQRRRMLNAGQSRDFTTDICIFSDNPLTLIHRGRSGTATENQIVMTAQQAQLNETYVCMYSQENWSDSLNTVFGIPIQYKWREVDDWSPSTASVEKISLAFFVSVEGHKEAQEMFGGLEHTDLYRGQGYLKSAHDETNAFIPIASDPFFFDKVHIVKERLGHMLAGSNLSYASRHILFYCSVLKVCFKELKENFTEKMLQITILLLNTFKILTSRISCIYTKEQVPMYLSTIVLNIAEGNTSASFLNSSFDGLMFMLIADSADVQTAQEKYNEKHTATLSYENFVEHCFKMLLRHSLVNMFFHQENTGRFYSKYSAANCWEAPYHWGLADEATIQKNLKIEGTSVINKYLMTEDKHNIDNLPVYIRQKIGEIMQTDRLSLHNFITRFFGKINFEQFNKSFIVPAELVAELGVVHSQSQIPLTLDQQKQMIELVYWTRWEFLHNGKLKECAIVQRHKLVPFIVNQINNVYGDRLTSILADVNEYNEFTAMEYETRYLPVTFTASETTQTNQLFASVFANIVTLEEFRASFVEIVGPEVTGQIQEVFLTDKLDVLKNLYEYCRKNNHSLVIKSESRLPFSCPANPSSPKFLQKLDGMSFNAYFHPIGLGWATKKYSTWISDLHPYMVQQVGNCRTKESFVTRVIDHAKTVRQLEPESISRYATGASIFYDKHSVQAVRSAYA